MLIAMDHNVSVLERAFQLARSGSCRSVMDIKRRLSSEGYSLGQVTGPVLNKQLQQLIQGALDQSPPRPPDGTSDR
jgi:hypothetical protein